MSKKAQDKHNKTEAPTDFLMFALDQEVFYMFENRIHTGKIMSRALIENIHDEVELAAGSPDWQPFGQNVIKYNTLHGIFKQDKIFGTHAALLEDLASGNPS